MAQTMTSLLGEIVDKTSHYLANQPANTVCLMMQFIHFTPQHVIQQSSRANYLLAKLFITNYYR